MGAGVSEEVRDVDFGNPCRELKVPIPPGGPALACILT
jgi:hypothetical protein